MRTVIFALLLAVAVSPCLADTTDDCIVRLGRSVGRLRQSQRIRLGSITNRYDAEKLKKILGDPRVTTPFLRNVGTDITTIDRIVSEHRMEVIQGTHKGARYAVFLGKEVVGTVNMAYDPAVKRASIGYAIAPRYQGRGPDFDIFDCVRQRKV